MSELVAPQEQVQPAGAAWYNLPLLLGATGTALFLACSPAAPWLSAYAPNATDTLHRLQPASAAHWLGTDEFGRDTFSRLLHGGRVSVYVSAIAVGIGLVGGAAVGMTAGYRSGRLDAVLMRAMD
jgi:peptide/nickel transport system permease protein